MRIHRGVVQASAMGPKITENDLMPGLCDMTLLMWNNTLYLHPRTNPNRLVGDLRNAAGKPRPGMASVAHPEFVHGLHVSLDSVTRTLGVQRLPDVEFNLLTMVRPSCTTLHCGVAMTAVFPLCFTPSTAMNPRRFSG